MDVGGLSGALLLFRLGLLKAGRDYPDYGTFL
jgi:hypothetical protein